MQISRNYTYITFPSSPSLTPRGHHRVPGWLPVLYGNFSPAVLLMVVYACQSYFPCPSHCFLPSTVSVSLFSISASPVIPSKEVHQYHFSRFHIHALCMNSNLEVTYKIREFFSDQHHHHHHHHYQQ